METLNRKISPQYKLVTQIALPTVNTVQLSNGIKVHSIYGGTQDLVKIDAIVNAGVLYSNHKLDAPLTSLMLNEGTQKYSSQQLAETFDFYGAHFNPMAEKDNAFTSLITLNKHIENTLPVMFDSLTQSIFPEKELEILLDRRKNNFLVDSEKTSFLARELFFEQLFGAEHPYGKSGKLEHYSEMSRDSLLQFYQNHYHAGNLELIVSGKTSDRVLQIIDNYFSALPVHEKSKVPNTAIITGNSQVKVITKNNAVQSSIRMGLSVINKTHRDYFGLKILTTILGGYFGSRLMKNIREEKGYTYGIHAMLVSLLQTGYLGIAADVKAENAQDALVEIEKEMEKLKNEPISEEELALVRNYMMGELLQSLDGPLALSDLYKAAIQFNLDFSYFTNFKDAILTITASDLQAIANKYFKLDKMVKVVAGKFE